MTEPDNPITELAAAAASLHELYAEYVEAGFTEPQALVALVRTVLRASLTRATGDDG